MKDTINKIISNIDQVTEIWARTDLSKYSFETFDLVPEGNNNKGLPFGTLIISKINQYTSFAETFVIMLKKYVFFFEEWGENKYDDMTKEEWREVLEKFWIPRNFWNPVLSDLNPAAFLPDLKKDLLDFRLSNEYVESFIDKLKDSKIVKLNEGSCEYDIFGHSDEICFIYYWWLNC